MTGFLEQFCFQEKPWNMETCLSFPKVNLRPKASGNADFNVLFEYANIFWHIKMFYTGPLNSHFILLLFPSFGIYSLTLRRTNDIEYLVLEGSSTIK